MFLNSRVPRLMECSRGPLKNFELFSDVSAVLCIYALYNSDVDLAEHRFLDIVVAPQLVVISHSQNCK